MTITIYNPDGTARVVFHDCTGVSEPADKNGLLKLHGKRNDETTADDFVITLAPGEYYRKIPAGS